MKLIYALTLCLLWSQSYASGSGPHVDTSAEVESTSEAPAAVESDDSEVMEDSSYVPASTGESDYSTMDESN